MAGPSILFAKSLYAYRLFLLSKNRLAALAFPIQTDPEFRLAAFFVG